MFRGPFWPATPDDPPFTVPSNDEVDSSDGSTASNTAGYKLSASCRVIADDTMEGATMKRLFGALLAIGLGALTLADTRLATGGERTVEILTQLERDWTDAERAGDTEKMGRIVADDWIGVDGDGKKRTKEQLIAHLKSGKTMSVELRPMDVKVLGEAAVVQGSDIEKGTANGEQTSVEIIWMDVFANRDGKWVCVRSQSARAHSAEAETAWRPRWPI